MPEDATAAIDEDAPAPAAASWHRMPAVLGALTLLALPLVARAAPSAAPWLLGYAVFAAAIALLALSGALGRASARAAAAEARAAALQARNWRLADELSRHREIVEARPEPICRQDAGGRIVYANRAHREAFGTDDETGTPNTPRRLMPASGEAEGPSGDLRLLTAAGPRWFARDETAMRDAAGRPIETQIVLHDVSERHAREDAARLAASEAEAAAAARSRLVAAVTHEVRTPIGGIIGMMELLLDTDLRPEQQSYATSVRSSASALLALIDDLLDHAALEAGRLAVAERGYSLHALVQEVCELLGPRAEEKSLALAGFVARKVPAEIVGDPARVRQVLLNLVGNAVKFTGSGGILVEARPAAGRLEIAVRDTGPGIAPSDQARIFTEFERADGSQGISGSGLGLAISRRLVEAMGGTLGLESRRGRGSVFTVSLPLRAAAGAPDIAPPALLDRPILLASASSTTRRAVALALRDEGARVSSFARAGRARRALEAGAGSADILVDLDMLEPLDDVLPRERSIVMLSPGEREALPGLKRRGTAYLIKPIRRASLVAQLTGKPAPAAEPAGPAAPPLRPLRVLIAEDDEVTAMILRSSLERLGHSVERVGNGHEAIARSGRDVPFDLALVDLNMPGLGGAAAAAAIRNREQRLGRSPTPIVAMSAGLTEAQASAATAAGIDAFLEKPVSAERLAACLGRVVGGERTGGCPIRGRPRLSHFR